MESLNYKIIATEDGSDSVGIGGTAITFHSTRGAMQESRHVFIEAGLQYFAKQHPAFKTIKIFEMGFGTGLNAALAAKEAQLLRKSIQYHSIDLMPLPESFFHKLNYGSLLDETELYRIITLTGWNQLVFVSPFFKLNKIKADFRTYLFTQTFDVIFYDAFAPEEAPALWTEGIFKKVFDTLNTGGVLVTYCSKSSVRKNLESAGFTVEKLQGPLGKRENHQSA